MILSHICQILSLNGFNRTDILNLKEQIREIALKSQNKRIYFDLDSFMSDADYRNMMGLSKLSFHDLCSHVSEMTKLRSSMSNKLPSTIFNIGMDAIKRSIWNARKALSKDFTPYCIGFKHITRDTIADKHTTDLAKTLFGGTHNPPILIKDSIYIKKSSQFSFQRRSLGMHKKRLNR